MLITLGDLKNILGSVTVPYCFWMSIYFNIIPMFVECYSTSVYHVFTYVSTCIYVTNAYITLGDL